jgi:hypothetical protein
VNNRGHKFPLDTRQIVQQSFDCVNPADRDGLAFAVHRRRLVAAALRGSSAGITQGFRKFTNNIVELVVEATGPWSSAAPML